MAEPSAQLDLLQAAPAPSPAEYTARYRAYARLHGKTPARMWDYDCLRWRGGRGAGFILWIARQWKAWRAHSGIGPKERIWHSQHAAFDLWLEHHAAPCATCGHDESLHYNNHLGACAFDGCSCSPGDPTTPAQRGSP